LLCGRQQLPYFCNMLITKIYSTSILFFWEKFINNMWTKIISCFKKMINYLNWSWSTIF
jgi:hypothetical protein